MGQLLAWYRSESAHELHKHKWRHGRISVSLVSLIHITHSLELSSLSSSIDTYDNNIDLYGMVLENTEIQRTF